MEIADIFWSSIPNFGLEVGMYKFYLDLIDILQFLNQGYNDPF